MANRRDAMPAPAASSGERSEEHTSELQSRLHLVCRLLLEKKKSAPIVKLIDSHFYLVRKRRNYHHHVTRPVISQPCLVWTQPRSASKHFLVHTARPSWPRA